MATQNLGNVRALIASSVAPTNTNLLWRNTGDSPESINIFNSVTNVWEPIAMSSGGQDNTASNVGTGEGVFAQKVGVDLQFKSLIAGTNITLSSDGTSITISSTDTGEANTASNLGTGEGLSTTKAGVNLPFKSLIGGTATTLSSDANEVTIDVDDTTKIPLTQRGAANGVATLGADSLVPIAQLPMIGMGITRTISSQAIADAATYTVDMATSAVVQLNVASAATAVTLAVSNINATSERRNKIILDNSANASALIVTFDDQSAAITFRRALNEFPGTYPNMNITANAVWEIEFEGEAAARILLDFIEVED